MRPDPSEFAEYYALYIDKVPDGDLALILEQTLTETVNLLTGIDDQKAMYRYDTGKWSIKEIIQHLIDGERVFQYRALRFGRGDETDLPGYDHDRYARDSQADYRSMHDLLDELSAVRAATISLYRSMNNDMLMRSGTANGNKQSVRSLFYIIPGHELHHMQVIRNKYLS